DPSMFPGFHTYFQGMRLYLFSETECRKRAETLTQLWKAYRDDSIAFASRDELTTACMDMVIALMNRPDYPDWRLPEGLEALEEATHLLRATGLASRLTARHDGALVSADKI